MVMKNIIFLDEISKADVASCGAKAANLGYLKKKFKVPEGFVVTTSAYSKFQKEKGLNKELENDIFSAFDKLETKFVAVRSSATSEDSSNASFAGQFSTYLNVSKGNLIQSIKNCFASLFNPRVLNYLVSKNISSEEVSMAVLVQKMV